MTPSEYRTALSTLGLSQLAAGRWLNVSPKTAQNYASKGPSGPAAVAIRMALTIKAKAEMYEAKRDDADPFGPESSTLWDERNHSFEAMSALMADVGLADALRVEEG
jgi:hypothetical protein